MAAATVIVLGLLPFQPPPPDFRPGAYDQAVRLTNRATQRWVEAQNSLLLKYKGGGLEGCGACRRRG